MIYYDSEEDFLKDLYEKKYGWREYYQDNPDICGEFNPKDYETEEEFKKAIENEEIAFRKMLYADYNSDLNSEDCETENDSAEESNEDPLNDIESIKVFALHETKKLTIAWKSTETIKSLLNGLNLASYNRIVGEDQAIDANDILEINSWICELKTEKYVSVTKELSGKTLEFNDRDKDKKYNMFYTSIVTSDLKTHNCMIIFEMLEFISENQLNLHIYEVYASDGSADELLLAIKNNVDFFDTLPPQRTHTLKTLTYEELDLKSTLYVLSFYEDFLKNYNTELLPTLDDQYDKINHKICTLELAKTIIDLPGVTISSDQTDEGVNISMRATIK